ncbi:MAG: flagellar basal body P-ring protein FlgI, partial [Pseudomonadales bacterium]
MKSFFLRQLLLVPLLLAVLASLMPNNVLADRLKDIASIAGVRSNALLGYGLVVGLDGTGDQTSQTPFTTQSFTNMLEQFGVTLPPGLRFQLKNVAAVAVHAELPAFAKPGQPVDVTVSSIGNAKSLRGGSLLLTSLKGADGQIYALAQGNLVVGGFGAEGADGSSITVNIPSVGRIPNGATVERMVDTGFDSATNLIFNLHRSDFTTAKRVADQINNMFGPQVAR